MQIELTFIACSSDVVFILVVFTCRNKFVKWFKLCLFCVRGVVWVSDLMMRNSLKGAFLMDASMFWLMLLQDFFCGNCKSPAGNTIIVLCKNIEMISCLCDDFQENIWRGGWD
ncbi:hypothetical protein L1049_018010 [Liquidambar formosana]|uniref:Uncharacterized protein n=1 Tax=Liquidambar formosana TaxID=63359 RepID=A0AAP0NIC2_LIQFO